MASENVKLSSRYPFAAWIVAGLIKDYLNRPSGYTPDSPKNRDIPWSRDCEDSDAWAMEELRQLEIEFTGK